MVRHLKSLRRMTRDHGWIHTLLEEAENERMHLLTALELRQPGPLFKMAVLGTQGKMWQRIRSTIMLREAISLCILATTSGILNWLADCLSLSHLIHPQVCL